MLGQDFRQVRIEQRLEVPSERCLDEAGIEARREWVPEPQAHGRAVVADQAGRRDPLPRRPVTRGEVPGCGRVVAAASRLRQHLLGNQQPDLDSHACEPDALAAHLRGGRHVMVPGEVASPHAGAIIHDGERALSRVGDEREARRARVAGIGDDLGQDRFLGGARIGVAEVFEEVQEINARFAHGPHLPAFGGDDQVPSGPSHPLPRAS